MRSPYQILGVSPDADEETIKAAFRHKAKLFHPDHNPDDPLSGRRLKRIMRARDALLDPGRRLFIDRKLAARAALNRKIRLALLASAGAAGASLSVWLVTLSEKARQAPSIERPEIFQEAQIGSGLADEGEGDFAEESEFRAIRENRENLARWRYHTHPRVLPRHSYRAKHHRRSVWGLNAVMRKARRFALR